MDPTEAGQPASCSRGHVYTGGGKARTSEEISTVCQHTTSGKQGNYIYNYQLTH